MKGKKRLTECEQKALVALKAEEIQEKAKKAKQREKKRESSTSKVRTAIGGQQMSFQPQPQVEAPLRYPVQQQERSKLSDPWFSFGQNVALTLLNYGLMQAGRHQDRKMLATQQRQQQQEKTVFKPEYKDVSFTDLKKGFGEISALKKRKLETVAPAAFKTPNKTNKSERKKVVANKSFEAGGLFDRFINRTTQSTQTEDTPKTQTKEFGTQIETQQDRRNAIDKMGFDELVMSIADNQIHEDDREYVNNRVATLRTQLFAQDEKGKHFLETQSKEQNKAFFDASYKGGFIGSPTMTRGNVDPETGQTYLIIDGHRLNRDGSYVLHAPGTLIQQTPDEAMAILKAVREQKLARFLDKKAKDAQDDYINATSRGLMKLKQNVRKGNDMSFEYFHSLSPDEREEVLSNADYGRYTDDFVAGYRDWKKRKNIPDTVINEEAAMQQQQQIIEALRGRNFNVPTDEQRAMLVKEFRENLPTGQTDETLDMLLGQNMEAPANMDDIFDDFMKGVESDNKADMKQPTTVIKPKFNRPVVTPPPAGGYDLKKITQSLTRTDPVDLSTGLQKSDEAIQRGNEAIQRSKQQLEKANEAIQRAKQQLEKSNVSNISNPTPRKNPVYAPASSSLDQSPATFGFYGPSAYPASLDANVKGFYNKVMLNVRGGTPATVMLGSSPSSWMTPSSVQMTPLTSFIGDQSINESNMQSPPPTMQSFEIDDTPQTKNTNEDTTAFSEFDNPAIETEYNSVGQLFMSEE